MVVDNFFDFLVTAMRCHWTYFGPTNIGNILNVLIFDLLNNILDFKISDKFDTQIWLRVWEPPIKKFNAKRKAMILVCCIVYPITEFTLVHHISCKLTMCILLLNLPMPHVARCRE